MKLKLYFLFVLLVSISSLSYTIKPEDKGNKAKLKVLIMDGENNHGIWPKTTVMIRDYLVETGLFSVDIARKHYTWKGEALIKEFPLNDGVQTYPVKEPKYDPDFSPDFQKYDVVISNLGWKASDLPNETKENFEKYMAKGGGLVIIHAADNSWGNWKEFNKMIGLGGWGGRNTKSGPYVYYTNQNEIQYDRSHGNCGQHGKQKEFVLTIRTPEHPIMKGLPQQWLHAKDELYEKLRGPAENITVLATAYSDKNEDQNRTGRHEPMLMTIEYQKGRIFHTTLGHMDYSMECVGFITTLQRGAEWAATGKVSQDIPSDFPNAEETSIRKWHNKK